jgi:hypothetical protein
MHVAMLPAEDDVLECQLCIDWHDAPIPLSVIDQLHGDAQGHLQVSYPDWKGNVKKIVADYFESKEIVNVFQSAIDIHKLTGDERVAALRADVIARAHEASPISRNRRAHDNYSEAYDEVEEEIHTDGGTKKTKIELTRVPTVEFNKRLDEKQEKKGLVKIDSVMRNYKFLIDAADEEGFLRPSKTEGKSTKPKCETNKGATVMSISAHVSIIAAKDKIIKNLRTQLSNAQKASGGSKDSTIAVAAAEVKVQLAERKLQDSKSKVLELESTIQSLNQKVAVSSAETAAAVANAKVEMMQQMMNAQSHKSPPSAQRSI